ncbi:ATP-dependent DNA helicase RecQ [Salmonella enterica subsp. enterica]|nr:ATP-dependent DNA helicase RecQ [Salmonella enterica subsp. enterica]
MVNGVNVAQAEVLNLESGAKQVLQETFGYQQFRPGQEAIIDTALSGRDCLVVMPTRRRQISVLSNPRVVADGLTVVVSPLISLMERPGRSATGERGGGGVPELYSKAASSSLR